MPYQAQKTTVNEDGRDKEALQVTFTNGALQELEDLAVYLKTNDLTEVVRIGIALLQNTKRQQEKLQDKSE